MKARAQIKPYLFILPSFILVCTFFYYPVLYAITSSFTDLRLGEKAIFVGLENYIRLFADPIFLKGLSNQLIITAADIAKNLLFPLIAAELLFFIKNKNIAFKLKTLFVVPMLVPGIVIMLIWVYMYNVNFGAINTLLDISGMGSLKHDWLREQGTALVSIIGIGFPFVSGLYFLIFHAGLGTISAEVEEAAMIDGCKSFELVRFIHIPSLMPYFGVVFVLTVINSLQDYVKILITTKGGPGYETYVPALQMYHTAFDSYQMGYASSIGVILFILIILLTIVSMRLSRTEKA